MSQAPSSTLFRKSSRRILAGSIAVGLASLAPTAPAAVLYYDGGVSAPIGTADGVSQGGTGTWSTAVANWDTGTAEVVWPGSGNTANFGGNPGTVTLGTAITADGIQLTVGGYTIATSTFVLSLGASGIAATNTSGTNTFSGTGSITLTAAQTWTQAAGGTLAVTAPIITGVNALTLAGAGTTTIGGAITSTVAAAAVAVTVTGGTSTTPTTFTNTGSSIQGDLAINGGFVNYTGGTQTTVNQLGVGTGSVYRQILLTNGGTFQVSTADFNDNVPTTTNKGAGFVFNVGTGGGTFQVDSGRVFTVDDGTTAITGTGLTAQQLQGAGALTKTGLGTLILRNQFGFSGSINITAGTLQATGPSGVLGNTTGATTIASGATFDVNGNVITDTDAVTVSGTGLASAPKGVITNNSTTAGSYAGAVVLAAPGVDFGPGTTGGLTLAGGLSATTAGTGFTHGTTGVTLGTGTLTLSGVIDSSVGQIIQSSTASPLTLTGNNAAFAGGFSIIKGTGSLATSANAAGTAAISLGDTVADTAAATLNFNGNTTTTFANAINVQSGTTGAVTIQNSSGNFTLNGLVTLANNVTLSNTNGAAAQVFNFAGGFAGTGNVTLNSTSGSGLTLSGPLNQAGNLTNSGAGNGISTLSGFVSNSVGTITQSSATSQLQLSGNNSSNTTTTVNATAGIIEFVNTNSLFAYPSGPARVSVSATGTLGLGFGGTGQFTASDLTNILNGSFPVTLASGSAIGIDPSVNSTLGLSLTNFANGNPFILTKLGAAVLSLTGTNTYTGNTIINGGVLSADDGVSLPSTNLSITALAANGTSAASYSPVSGSFTRTLGISAGQVQLTGGNSGFTALGTPTSINLGGAGAALTFGGTAFTATGLLLNDTAATSTINFQNPLALNGAVRTVAVNSTTAGTAATLSGALTGTGASGLTKTGSGQLIVNNPGNTYAGVTTASAGTLTFAGQGSLPTTGGVVLQPAATLQVLNDGTGSNGTIAQGNQISFGTSSATPTTLFVGSNGSANTGNTIAFGVLNNQFNAGNSASLNITGANGYNASFSSLALPNGSGNNTILLPTTANIILGNVTNGGTGGTGNYDSLIFLGTSSGNRITGTVADAAAGSITAGNYTRLLVGNIGSAVFAGVASNTVTIASSSTNTYTGGTLIGNGTAANNGTLIVNGVIGGSLVSVLGGGTLGGTGTIGNGTATLQNTQGSVVVSGGTTAATQGNLSFLDNTLGTLTIQGNAFATPATQSLTLGGTTAGATSILNFETGTNATDVITLSGGNSNKVLVQLGGATINLTALAGQTLGVGTYNLLNFASGSTFTGGFTLGSFTPAAGQSYFLNNTGTAEQLIVGNTGAANTSLYFTGAASNILTAVNGSGDAANFATTRAGTGSTGLPVSTTNLFFTADTATNNFSTTLGGGPLTVNSLSFTGTGTPAAANPVTIANGTLTLLAANGFTDSQTAPVTYPAGTGVVVQPGSAAHTISANVVLGNSQTFEIDNALASPLTVSGVVSGGSLLNKTGPGGLTLSNAANSFSGGLTLNSGAVNFAVDGNLGAATGGITFNGGTLNSTATTGAVTLAGTRTLTVNAAGGTLATAGSLTAGKVAVGGNQLVGTGAFFHTGASDLQFSVAQTGYSGNFHVAGLTESSVAYALGTGTVYVDAGGELSINTTNGFINPLIITGGTISPIFTSAGAIAVINSPTITAAGNFTLSPRSFNGTTLQLGYTFNSPISGSGSLTGIVPATSTTANQAAINLNGNNSAWTGSFSTAGSTQLNGVRVYLGNANALPTGGATFTVGSTLDLNGTTLASAIPLTIGGALNTNFPTSLTNSSAAQAATYSGNITLTSTIEVGSTTGIGITLSGNIGETTSASGLIKFPSTGQTLTLSGVNSYTGANQILGGTLSVATLANGGTNSGLGASSNAAANLVFGSTGVNSGLQYTGATATSDRAFTITAATTATFDVTQSGTSLSLAGATGTATTGLVTKIGAGRLLLTGSNTYTGATAVTAGTFGLGAGGSLANTAVTVSNSGSTFAVVPGGAGNNTLAGSLNLGAATNFTMADGAISTFSITGASTLAPASGLSTSLTFDVMGNSSTAAVTTDVLAIGAGVTVGAAKAVIYLNEINPATDLQTGVAFNLITGTSGLNNNFTLGTSRVVANGKAYLVALGGSATAETITFTNALMSAYYNGMGSTTALNGTNSGVTNFSSDPDGNMDLGAQPSAATDVYFTAANVTAPVTIASLGINSSFNSLNFTANAPAVTINNGGTNTLTLYSGVSAAAGAGAAVVNVPITFAANQTITNNSTNGLTLGAGAVAGSSNLVFAGSGTTVISGGTFTTSGNITADSSAGPVTISSPATLGANFILTNNSASTLTTGTIAAGANTVTVAGTGTGTTALGALTATGAVNLNQSGPASIAGLAGASSVVLTDAGGNLTFSGASSVKTLSVNTLAPIDIGSGVFTLSNLGAQTLLSTTGGTINGTGSIALSGTTGTAGDNGVNPGKTLTINAKLTGNTDFEIYQAGGAGTFVLTGANTYNNFLFSVPSTLSVSSLGTVGTPGPVGQGVAGTSGNLNFGSSGGAPTLLYTGTGESTNHPIFLSNTSGAIIDQSGTGKLLFSAFSTAANSKTLTLQGSTAGTGEISAAIVDNGAGLTSVTKLGSNTWTLSGLNTYTGTTTVTAGTLVLSGNRTATAGAFNVGTAQASGITPTVGTLQITNGNFIANTVTLGNGASVLNGFIQQSGGTVTLTGGAELLVGNNNAGNAGQYDLSGGTLTSNTASTIRGIILGTNTSTTGTFNLSGSGVIALPANALELGRADSAATAATGIFNQSGGSATFGNLYVAGGPTANANLVGTLNLTGGTFVATNFLNLANNPGAVATINLGGTSQVTLPAFPTARGAASVSNLTFDGGTLIPAAASTAYLSGLTHAYLTANGAKLNVASGNDITIAQVLENAPAATGTLAKLGTGVLTLSGANTYTGATAVNAGTLRAGSAGTSFGVNSALTVANVAGATLDLNGNNSTVGSLAGGGTTGGGVTLGAGTLTTGGDNTSTSFGGSITGSGSLVKQGTGTQTITSTVAYTGATTVRGGILNVQGSLSGTTGVNVSNSGSLFFSGTNVINSAAPIVLGPTGGTFGFNTGSSASAPFTQTSASLTLSAGSTIDFGIGTNATLTFTSLSLAGNPLTVDHYSGTASYVGGNPGDGMENGSNTDRFLTSTALTDAQLASVSFYNDAHQLLATGAHEITYNGGFEIVPIPEPSTLYSALLAVGLIGLRERRRFRRLSSPHP